MKSTETITLAKLRNDLKMVCGNRLTNITSFYHRVRTARVHKRAKKIFGMSCIKNTLGLFIIVRLFVKLTYTTWYNTVSRPISADKISVAQPSHCRGQSGSLSSAVIFCNTSLAFRMWVTSLQHLFRPARPLKAHFVQRWSLSITNALEI